MAFQRKTYSQKDRRQSMDDMISAIKQDDASVFLRLVEEMRHHLGHAAALKIIRLKKRHDKVILQYIVEHSATHCLSALIDIRFDVGLSAEINLYDIRYLKCEVSFVQTHFKHLVFFGYPPSYLILSAFRDNNVDFVVSTIKQYRDLFTQKERQKFILDALQYSLQHQNVGSLYSVMQALSWTIDDALEYRPDNGNAQLASDFIRSIAVNSHGSLHIAFELLDRKLISKELLAFCLQDRQNYRKTLTCGSDIHLPLYLELLFNSNKNVFRDTLSTFFSTFSIKEGLHELKEKTALLMNTQSRFEIGLHLTNCARSKKDNVVDKDALCFILNYFKQEQALLIPFIASKRAILAVLEQHYADVTVKFSSVVNVISLMTKGWFSPKMPQSAQGIMREQMMGVNWLLRRCEWSDHIATTLLKENDTVDVWMSMVMRFADEDKPVAIALLHLAIERFGVHAVTGAIDSQPIINHLMVCYSPLELLHNELPIATKTMLLKRLG